MKLDTCLHWRKLALYSTRIQKTRTLICWYHQSWQMSIGTSIYKDLQLRSQSTWEVIKGFVCFPCQSSWTKNTHSQNSISSQRPESLSTSFLGCHFLCLRDMVQYLQKYQKAWLVLKGCSFCCKPKSTIESGYLGPRLQQLSDSGQRLSIDNLSLCPAKIRIIHDEITCRSLVKTLDIIYHL